jgi:glycosyltransferase involved in cell wall biosynthesis
LTLAALPSGRPPVVVTFHNLWHGGPLTLPLRLLAPGAASAIAVSSAVRDRLAAYSVRPKELVVIPNGLDLAAFPPAPPHSREQPFTAAFLGRLTEEKGVSVLIEAARRSSGFEVRGSDQTDQTDQTDRTDLSSRTPNPDYSDPEVRFVVAGDGPLRSEVVAEASCPGSRLEYLGHQEDVLSIYHQADAVLMPSLAEGHPMTALEAMACGLPLVASRAGGLPEIVVEGETGILVPPGDAGALVEAVAALSADRQRARAMGAAGRRRVEAEFTLERMLEGTVDVYRRVLD